MEKFGDKGKEASKAENMSGYLLQSDIVDFEVTDLAKAGKFAKIVILLLKPILSTSIYRKFNAEKGWTDFIEDDKNSVHSSKSDQGICPNLDDTTWQDRLVIGNDCLLLLIEDGGPNDDDGEANSQVVDPGAIFTVDEIVLAFTSEEAEYNKLRGLSS